MDITVNCWASITRISVPKPIERLPFLLKERFVCGELNFLICLAEFYPQYFDGVDVMNLPVQFDNYTHDMKIHRIGEDQDVRKLQVSVQASYIEFGVTGCNRFCGESIFCYEYCENTLRNKMGDQ
ncbi:hypothetical protein DVH24_001382 [Malus domestica]|uniref:Uncharacterized protein n=1 Tax=Malus domestica TaxID=3750 RepID=A0A498K1G2_MALDO|nr:hypothetical protein DVH24_001382 [Malus domestica]